MVGARHGHQRRAQVGLIRAQKIPELGEQWPIIEGRGGYVGEACFSPHTHSPPTNPGGQAEFIVLLLLSHLRDYVDITRETDFLTLIPTLMMQGGCCRVGGLQISLRM